MQRLPSSVHLNCKIYTKPTELSEVWCVCVAGPSAAVCVGGCLHPLERVISLSWRVFTAVERIRSRERERREKGGRDDCAGWKEEGETHKKRALASTLQHLFVVCSWHSSGVPRAYSDYKWRNKWTLALHHKWPFEKEKRRGSLKRRERRMLG